MDLKRIFVTYNLLGLILPCLHRVPNAPLNENALKLAEIQVFERCLKYGTSPDYTRKKKAEEPEMILNIKLAA